MSSAIVRDTWDNIVLVTRDGTTDATWDGRVKNLIYDSVLMDWVADTGSGGTGGGSTGVPTVSSATLTSVSAGTSSATLLASNASRKGAKFYNDSTSDCYLALAATASTSAFSIKMAAGSYYSLEFPIYTGAISALWDTATGAMRVTEL